MSVELITKEGLKDALTRFRARGDERWAQKSELPTREVIEEMAAEAVADAVSSMSGLDDADMDDIFDALNDSQD